MVMERLLLFDLDGVLVTAGDGDTRNGKEILTIHEALMQQIESFEWPVSVLTHRTRHEAYQIVTALGLEVEELAGVFSANEIVFCDLSFNGVVDLIKNGSRKGRLLPYISRSLNVARENIVFIDDRIENVRDMAAQGTGLSLRVPPARILGDGRLETFDLSKTLFQIQEWFQTENREPGTIVEVNPVIVDNLGKFSSGIKLRRHSGDLYGRIRGVLKGARSIAARLFAPGR